MQFPNDWWTVEANTDAIGAFGIHRMLTPARLILPETLRNTEGVAHFVETMPPRLAYANPNFLRFARPGSEAWRHHLTYAHLTFEEARELVVQNQSSWFDSAHVLAMNPNTDSRTLKEILLHSREESTRKNIALHPNATQIGWEAWRAALEFGFNITIMMRPLCNLRNENMRLQDQVVKTLTDNERYAHLLPEFHRIFGRPLKATEITKSMLGRNSGCINKKVTMCLENGIPLFAYLETARFARLLFTSHDFRVQFLANNEIVKWCSSVTFPDATELTSWATLLARLCPATQLLKEEFWKFADNSDFKQVQSKFENMTFESKPKRALAFYRSQYKCETLRAIARTPFSHIDGRLLPAESPLLTTSLARGGIVVEHKSLGSLNVTLCRNWRDVRRLGLSLSNCLSSSGRYERMLTTGSHFLVGVSGPQGAIAAILFDVNGIITESGGKNNARVDTSILLTAQKEFLIASDAVGK